MNISSPNKAMKKVGRGHIFVSSFFLANLWLSGYLRNAFCQICKVQILISFTMGNNKDTSQDLRGKITGIKEMGASGAQIAAAIGICKRMVERIL